MTIADRIHRARRASDLKLAEKLAQRGYVRSARALIRRETDGPSPIIEINHTAKRSVR